jgi:hypothetical protein
MAAYQGQVYPTLSVLTPIVKQTISKNISPKITVETKPNDSHPWKDFNRVIFMNSLIVKS